MKRTVSLIVSALLTLVVVGMGTVGPVSAAVAPGSTSSGLSIPPRKNYTVNPGGTVTDNFVVGNVDQSAPLNITLKVIDFTFTDQTGTPKLDLRPNAPQTTWSIKPFTTLPPTFTVPAGQTKTIKVTFKIPKTQGAGSYYSALQYAATGPDGNNVSLSASGVSLVFISIPGTVNEKMTLEKFGVYQLTADKTTGHYQYISTNARPQSIAYTLLNTGNVAENPVGSATIDPTFFGKTINIDNINPSSSLALIGQTRLFTTCIQKEDAIVQLNGTSTIASQCKTKPNILPGRYTLHIDALYGQNGNATREISDTVVFWYLPWWFLVAFGVLILVIVGLVLWILRKIRRRVNKKAMRARR